MDNKKSHSGVFELFRSELDRRKNDKTAVVYDITVFLLSVIFARTHLIFGTYPIAPAFIAVLSRGVLFSLLGSVIGALSLGNSGVIHAVVAVATVFLRALLSFGKSENSTPFTEPLLYRIASASSAVFIGSVYEALYGGLKIGGVLFGAVGVLSSALFTFLFSGIYDGGISFSDMLCAENCGIFKTRREKDKIAMIFYFASLAAFTFLISFALKGYNIFGINFSHVFASALTVITAKRFGIKCACAAGFISGLAIAPLLSVSFLLVGAACGLLFKLGAVYAVAAGGIIISVWSFYTDGAIGFLSVFPEYALSAIILFPFLGKVKSADSGKDLKSAEENAQSMASTASVIYKSKKQDGWRIEEALSDISKSLLAYSEGDVQISREEYHSLITNCISNFCAGCDNFSECKKISPAPCAESIDNLSTKLYKNESINICNDKLFPNYCKNSEGLKSEIEKTRNSFTEYKMRDRLTLCTSEWYALLSELFAERTSAIGDSLIRDTENEKKLKDAFSAFGLECSSVLIFGEKRKHIIAAGLDRDGSVITSREFITVMENSLGKMLCKPEYYRRGDIALLECDTLPCLKTEFAFAESRGNETMVSGDSFKSFSDSCGRDYFLISDGMGSGDTASKTSKFTVDYLSSLLSLCCEKGTALKLLNSAIRERGLECCATVDLFEIDTYGGSSCFCKCGSAPSYIKKEGSIFRIKSETAPIGLMKKIDAERIKSEIKAGDYIIMLSDGVAQNEKEEGRLIELLGKTPSESLQEYANDILQGLKAEGTHGDDMTVAVIKIQNF